MVVQQCTSDIKNLMRRTSQEIIEIGQKLTDVKAQLKHGNFRNWLKAEFNWSVKTASRFMQVAENFKYDNLTHLDIAASALYLLASPSTSEEARVEALKRARQGENISYTKAKTIVSKHKKTTKLKSKKPVTFDVHAETVEYSSIKSTKQDGNETSSVPDVLVELTGKEVETETRLLSTQDFEERTESKDKHLVPTVERNREQIEDTTPTPDCIVNKTAIAQNKPDTITTEMEIKIKQLTPEQLAWVIINSVKNGLSKCHLKAIIRAAQQVLNQLN
jgi:hypothetical protein